MRARLLALWANYNRAITIVVLVIALVFIFESLSPATRAVLVQILFANRLVVLLLLSFSLLMLSLLFSAGQRLDAWVFRLLNLRGHHPRWLDHFMWGFTQIGNGLFGIAVGVVIYFAGQRALAMSLLVGILTLWLVVELIKVVVDRSRPFIALENTRVIGWRERGLSFPSGHTAQTFFMTTLLTQLAPVGALLGSVIYLAAALVGVTRVYVGVHYPRDVLAGAVLGGVWGILIGLFQLHLADSLF